VVDASFLNGLCVTAKEDGVQQLVVGALVAHDNTVLLLQRPIDDFMGGIFELPSGKVEHGQALDVALRRDVEEETGLMVTAINEYLGSFDYSSGSGARLTYTDSFHYLRSSDYWAYWKSYGGKSHGAYVALAVGSVEYCFPYIGCVGVTYPFDEITARGDGTYGWYANDGG
jgi:predicted NUDIX family NTP pyrophosphohydrolase